MSASITLCVAALILITASFAVALPKSHFQNGGWDISWGFACDFIGHDVGSFSSTGEECGPLCKEYNSINLCNAFTWTTYLGGTCWMKSFSAWTSGGSAEMAYDTGDQSMVCGFLGN